MQSAKLTQDELCDKDGPVRHSRTGVKTHVERKDEVRNPTHAPLVPVGLEQEQSTCFVCLRS